MPMPFKKSSSLNISKPSRIEAMYGSAKNELTGTKPTKKPKKKSLMSKMDRIARLLRQNPNSQVMSDIATMGKMRYPGE